MAGASSYTDEIGERICMRIAEGESIRQICRDDDMPAMSTVFKWLRDHDAFSEQYARAREAQADAMDAEILDTARATTNENAQAARVQIDAFKWRAARLAPTRYGDRIQHDHTHTLDIEEARARLAEIMSKCLTPPSSTD